MSSWKWPLSHTICSLKNEKNWFPSILPSSLTAEMEVHILNTTLQWLAERILISQQRGYCCHGLGSFIMRESAANDNTCEEGDSSQPVPSYSPYVPVNVSPSLVSALILVCKDWPWSSPILTAGLRGNASSAFRHPPELGRDASRGQNEDVEMFLLQSSKNVLLATLPFSLSQQDNICISLYPSKSVIAVTALSAIISKTD